MDERDDACCASQKFRWEMLLVYFWVASGEMFVFMIDYMLLENVVDGWSLALFTRSCERRFAFAVCFTADFARGCLINVVHPLIYR